MEGKYLAENTKVSEEYLKCCWLCFLKCWKILGGFIRSVGEFRAEVFEVLEDSWREILKCKTIGGN